MKNTKSAIIAIVFGFLPYRPSAAYADDSSSIAPDIAVIIDRHAGSNQKMMAIRHLSEHPPDATTAQGKRTIAALARQTHYDLEPVRMAAFDVLIRMVGSGSAAALRAAEAPVIDTLMEDLKAAMEGWKSAAELEKTPVISDSVSRRKIVRLLAGGSAEERRRLQRLDEPLKVRLTKDLELIDLEEPSVRLETLSVLRQIDPMRAEAVPVVLRGLIDEDAKVRAAAKEYASVDFNDLDDATRAAIASNLLDMDKRLARAAREMVPRPVPEAFKPFVARAAVAATDEASAMAILKEQSVGPEDLAHAIYLSLRASGEAEQLRLLKFVSRYGDNSILNNSRLLRIAVAWLVVHGDDELRAAAAALLTNTAARKEVDQAIVLAVANGEILSPAMLKMLKPDVEQFSLLMKEPLINGTLQAKCAAAEGLSVTGTENPAIRAALTSFLRSPETLLRHAAAKALNTPEAFARASVTDLLNDLRSDSVSLRQLAARQLDELHLEPREFTTAIIRAVDQRDMPAREGLIAAMSFANQNSRNPIDVLKESAAKDTDAAKRVYARAALRSLETTQRQAKEKTP